MIKAGDDVLVAASRKPARISRIVTMDGVLEQAIAGQAVTLVLDREVDVSRGDVLVHPGQTPDYSNQFQRGWCGCMTTRPIRAVRIC